MSLFKFNSFLISFSLIVSSVFFSYPVLAQKKVNSYNTTQTTSIQKDDSSLNREEIKAHYNWHQGPYLSFDFLGGPGVGVGLSGGYQFTHYLAGEIGIQTGVALFAGEVNLEYLAIKGLLPLGNRFSLFGKIGAAHQRYKDEFFGLEDKLHKGIGPFFGLGMEFSITQNFGIALGTEVVTFTDKVNHFAGEEKEGHGNVFFNLSFLYHFPV